jgi:hypothetical protein
VKPCKDCGSTTRKTPHPGPRCVTCHRAIVKVRRLAAQQKRVLQVYGITAEEYDRIYEVHGGRCAICRRATGARKRLSVDHDHAQAVLDGHDADKGCPRCVRGLLCSTCNKTHGHLRDDPEAWDRGAEYLRNWPSGANGAGTATEPARNPGLALTA